MQSVAPLLQKPSPAAVQKKISSPSIKPVINWLQYKLAGSSKAKRTENHRLALNRDDELRRQSYGPADDGSDQFSNRDSTYSSASALDALASVRPLPLTAPPSLSPSRDSSSDLSDPHTFRSMAASFSPLPDSSSSSQPPSIRNPDDAQINVSPEAVQAPLHTIPHPRNNIPVDSSLLQQFTTFPEPVTRVDRRDENTADSHVKRDPSMLRLTGKHPFNAGKDSSCDKQ